MKRKDPPKDPELYPNAKKRRKKSQRKQWKLEQKEKVGVLIESFTIKTKLNTILLDSPKVLESYPCFVNMLDKLVLLVSHVSREASVLSNAYAVYCFDTNHPEWLKDSLANGKSSKSALQQFFLNIIHLLTKVPEKDEGFRDKCLEDFFLSVYLPLQPELEKRIHQFALSSKGFSQYKATTARELATVALTSFAHATDNRLKSYLYAFTGKPKKVKGSKLTKEEKKQQRHRVMNIMSKLQKWGSVDASFSKEDLGLMNSLNTEKWETFKEAGNWKSPDAFASLDVLYILLKGAESYIQEKSQLPQEDQKYWPRLKHWSLLPVNSFQRRSLLLDTDLLRCLLVKSKVISASEFPKIDLSGQRESDLWNLAFNTSKLLSKTTTTKSFALSIRTDGVQASVGFFRAKEIPIEIKLDKKKTKSKKKDKEENGVLLETDVHKGDFKGRNVVGIDPGKIVMMQAYRFGEKEVDFSLSRKNYLKQGKFFFQRQMVTKWKKKASEKTREALSKASNMTFKTSSWERMTQSLKIKSEIDPYMFEHYMKKQYRNLKFKVYRFKNKILDSFIAENFDSNKDVVAYGSAKYNCSGKGDIKVPQVGLIKKLRQHEIDVVLVDEFHTTKKCFGCQEELSKSSSKNINYRMRADGDRISRGIRRCANLLCKTQDVHRDINAAKNIGFILQERLQGNGRPSYLSRPRIEEKEKAKESLSAPVKTPKQTGGILTKIICGQKGSSKSKVRVLGSSN